MTDSATIDYHKKYFSVILKLTGMIFVTAFLAGILLSFLISPARAIEINPSVDNQPLLCKYSFTKWIFCDTHTGIRGVNGTQGIQGLPNFSAMYYNATNFTSTQNNATFQGSIDNSILYSNYTTFAGATIYDNINESYAYLPGRIGGQTLQGGIGAFEILKLNGSLNGGPVILQPIGGSVGIGIPPSYKLDVFGEGSAGSSMRFVSNISYPSVDLLAHANSASSSGQLNLRASRGSFLAPEVVQNGDKLGGIRALGYSAAAGTTAASSGIQFWLDGAPDSGGDTTDMPGRIVFVTASDGSTTLTERARITSTGTVGIGTSSPTSMLDATGSARFRNCSGTPTMDAGGNMTCASDEKLKTAITPYTVNTSKLASVTPKHYRWNAASGFDSSHINTGFSAQDIQQIYPECIIARDDVTYVQDVVKGQNGEEDTATMREVRTGTQTLAIDDKCLIAVLFSAAKEHQSKIKILEEKVDKLEKGTVKP